MYWKINVVVDKALSPPGMALNTFTKFLDYCGYIQGDKNVFTESFNSESFLSKYSVWRHPLKEAFFVSYVN